MVLGNLSLENLFSIGLSALADSSPVWIQVSDTLIFSGRTSSGFVVLVDACPGTGGILVKPPSRGFCWIG